MSASASAAPDPGASVTEGKATIYFPSSKGVFYNPPQIPNRDLSVLALRQFSQIWAKEVEDKAAKKAARVAAAIARDAASGAAAASPKAAPDAAAPAPPDTGVRVLDAMTASGLRALRYTLEVDEVSQVVANDLDPTAVSTLLENVRRNGLTEEQVVPSTGDAVAVMHASKPPTARRFEAVELDPYGSAAPFLDSAMQVRDRGLHSISARFT